MEAFFRFFNIGTLAVVVFSVPFFISVFTESNLFLSLFFGALILIGVFVHLNYNFERIIFGVEDIKLTSRFSSKTKEITINEIKYWGERYERSAGRNGGYWVLRIVLMSSESLDFYKIEYKQYPELKTFLKNLNISKKPKSIVFKKEIERYERSANQMNNCLIILFIILFFAMGFYSMYLLFS